MICSIKYHLYVIQNAINEISSWEGNSEDKIAMIRKANDCISHIMSYVENHKTLGKNVIKKIFDIQQELSFSVHAASKADDHLSEEESIEWEKATEHVLLLGIKLMEKIKKKAL